MAILPDTSAPRLRDGLLEIESKRLERKVKAVECIRESYNLFARAWLEIQGTLTEADLNQGIPELVLEAAVQYHWVTYPWPRQVRRRRTFAGSWIPNAPVIDYVWEAIPDSELVERFGRFKVAINFRAWFLGLLAGRIAFWQSQAGSYGIANASFKEQEAVADTPPDEKLQPDAPVAEIRGEVPHAVRQSRSGTKAKPGPKQDRETAQRVRDIVARIAGSDPWKSKLDDICEALDEEKIPCPKTWRNRDPAIPNWTAAATTDPQLARKVIEYRLKIAGR